MIYAAICRRAFPHFYTFVIFLPYSILLEELNTDVLIYRMNSLEPIETTRYFFSLLVLQWAEIQKKVLVQLFVEASLFASIFFYIFIKKCSKGEQKMKVKIVLIYKLYILPPFLAHDVFHFPLFFTIHFHRFSFPL